MNELRWCDNIKRSTTVDVMDHTPQNHNAGKNVKTPIQSWTICSQSLLYRDSENIWGFFTRDQVLLEKRFSETFIRKMVSKTTISVFDQLILRPTSHVHFAKALVSGQQSVTWFMCSLWRLSKDLLVSLICNRRRRGRCTQHPVDNND